MRKEQILRQQAKASPQETATKRKPSSVGISSTKDELFVATSQEGVSPRDSNEAK